MSDAAPSSFLEAAAGLAPQIRSCAEEIEQSRRLPLPLVEAIAQAGLFRLWIPRSLGGEETDPMTLVRVVEEVSRADGAAGWCVAIGGEYGAFGGYLPVEAAREVYGNDRGVRTAGAFRPFGDAAVVAGGYRVTGRWPLGSGCQHSAWIVGGCRILDGDQPRLRPDGTPVTRLLFFSASDCEILDNSWPPPRKRPKSARSSGVENRLTKRQSDKGTDGKFAENALRLVISEQSNERGRA